MPPVHYRQSDARTGVSLTSVVLETKQFVHFWSAIINYFKLTLNGDHSVQQVNGDGGGLPDDFFLRHQRHLVTQQSRDTGLCTVTDCSQFIAEILKMSLVLQNCIVFSYPPSSAITTRPSAKVISCWVM